MLKTFLIIFKTFYIFQFDPTDPSLYKDLQGPCDKNAVA